MCDAVSPQQIKNYFVTKRLNGVIGPFSRRLSPSSFSFFLLLQYINDRAIKNTSWDLVLGIILMLILETFMSLTK